MAVEVHTDSRNTKIGAWLIWKKYYLRRGGWKTPGKALERADVRGRRWVGA